MKAQIVQIMNPRTSRYTKINKDKGTIASKKSKGPYKNIPIITRNKEARSTYGSSRK